MNARADQFKRDRLVKHETGGLARFTIQTRLYAAAVAYVLSMATIAGLAYVGREQAQSGLASMHEAITAQRNGGDMDMMHDAIRADVLAALSGDASQTSEARANLAEHVRRMDDAAAAVKEHSTDDSVLKALDDVRAPVAAYQAEAGRVVDLSSSDMDAAKAEMPAFLEKFGALEDSLGDLNTEIEKASVAHQQAAGDEVDGVVTLVTIFCAFAGVVGGAISVVLVNGIVRSLSRTLETLHEFARGDCTVQAPTIGNDEVAAMTRALNESIGNTGAAIRSVSDGANSLSVSAGALSRTAEGMSGEVGSMGHQLQSTSTGADQVSANVQAVSAGMDAMSAAMHEIARNAVQAAKVAAQAVQASEGTSAAVGRLGESGNEIGQFVKVISTIAHQTNLLALNATIEAARAGEAGRGFAVVANEVKELARETAKATDDIARKIEAIQADTRMAVESNNEITQVIGQINDLQTAIAGAVEEQSVTTKEIARNLQEAAQGSASVASGVSEMARSAGATSSGAAEFEASTQRLARLAVELESTCARFHT